MQACLAIRKCEAGRVRGALPVDSRHNFWNFSVDSLLRVDTTSFSSSNWLLSQASEKGSPRNSMR
jgi:hypothetical protein